MSTSGISTSGISTLEMNVYNIASGTILCISFVCLILGYFQIFVFGASLALIIFAAGAIMSFNENKQEQQTLNEQIKECQDSIAETKILLTSCNNSIKDNAKTCNDVNTVKQNNDLVESIEPTLASMESSMATLIPKIITSLTNILNALTAFQTDKKPGPLKAAIQQELDLTKDLSVDRTEFDKIGKLLTQNGITSSRYNTLKTTVDRVQYLLNNNKTSLEAILDACTDTSCNEGSINVIKTMNYTEF